jgi:hypothetical protein
LMLRSTKLVKRIVFVSFSALVALLPLVLHIDACQ